VTLVGDACNAENDQRCGEYGDPRRNEEKRVLNRYSNGVGDRGGKDWGDECYSIGRISQIFERNEKVKEIPISQRSSNVNPPSSSLFPPHRT
jgi:hypothetical protein